MAAQKKTTINLNQFKFKRPNYKDVEELREKVQEIKHLYHSQQCLKTEIQRKEIHHPQIMKEPHLANIGTIRRKNGEIICTATVINADKGKIPQFVATAAHCVGEWFPKPGFDGWTFDPWRLKVRERVLREQTPQILFCPFYEDSNNNKHEKDDNQQDEKDEKNDDGEGNDASKCAVVKELYVLNGHTRLPPLLLKMKEKGQKCYAQYKIADFGLPWYANAKFENIEQKKRREETLVQMSEILEGRGKIGKEPSVSDCSKIKAFQNWLSRDKYEINEAYMDIAILKLGEMVEWKTQNVKITGIPIHEHLTTKKINHLRFPIKGIHKNIEHMIAAGYPNPNKHLLLKSWTYPVNTNDDDYVNCMNTINRELLYQQHSELYLPNDGFQTEGSSGGPLMVKTIDGQTKMIGVYSKYSIHLDKNSAIHTVDEGGLEVTPFRIYSIYSLFSEIAMETIKEIINSGDNTETVMRAYNKNKVNNKLKQYYSVLAELESF